MTIPKPMRSMNTVRKRTRRDARRKRQSLRDFGFWILDFGFLAWAVGQSKIRNPKSKIQYTARRAQTPRPLRYRRNADHRRRRVTRRVFPRARYGLRLSGRRGPLR